MSISHDSEEIELLLRISNGDEHAFRQLFIKFAPVIQRKIARIIPSTPIQEDIVQETFLKIWLNRDELPEIEYFITWMTRIAYNRALTHLRDEAIHQRAIARIQVLAEGTNTAREYETGQTVDFRILRGVIAAAIARLPPQQKKIYLLQREQGLLIREISEQLQLSPQTIKNSLGLALKSIRHFMESRGHFLLLFTLTCSGKNFF